MAPSCDPVLTGWQPWWSGLAPRLANLLLEPLFQGQEAPPDERLLTRVQDVVCEPCEGSDLSSGTERESGRLSRQGPSCLPGAAHWPCLEQLGDRDSSFFGP